VHTDNGGLTRTLKSILLDEAFIPVNPAQFGHPEWHSESNPAVDPNQLGSQQAPTIGMFLELNTDWSSIPVSR
jgi:hypothetical protein